MALTKLTFGFLKGCSFQNLSLNFTFPGHEEIELIENGGETAVNLSNLDKYVSTLAEFYLVETNKAQVLSFREGFEKVIDKIIYSV